jgi:CheY-like chemotaxis protein
MTEPKPPPLRVLLVEDAADDAELVARALRDGGLEIDTRVVASEAELVAALPAFAPEVVLADWNLPNFSGAAAVVAIHHWDLAVPVILVSGTAGEELVVKALHSGATDSSSSITWRRSSPPYGERSPRAQRRASGCGSGPSSRHRRPQCAARSTRWRTRS